MNQIFSVKKVLIPIDNKACKVKAYQVKKRLDKSEKICYNRLIKNE